MASRFLWAHRLVSTICKNWLGQQRHNLHFLKKKNTTVKTLHYPPILCNYRIIAALLKTKLPQRSDKRFYFEAIKFPSGNFSFHSFNSSMLSCQNTWVSLKQGLHQYWCLQINWFLRLVIAIFPCPCPLLFSQLDLQTRLCDWPDPISTLTNPVALIWVITTFTPSSLQCSVANYSVV